MWIICLDMHIKTDPVKIFRKCGGQLRMSEALEHGITRYMLYSLLDKALIEQISRGVYRLVELHPASNHDLELASVLADHGY